MKLEEVKGRYVALPRKIKDITLAIHLSSIFFYLLLSSSFFIKVIVNVIVKCLILDIYLPKETITVLKPNECIRAVTCSCPFRSAS